MDMTSETFILHANDSCRATVAANLHRFLDSLPSDKSWRVEVRRESARRSDPQNRSAAPDRVMVAARLLAGMLANPNGPIQSNEQSGCDYVNCSADSLSQVALELADALIAEGAK